ncbi:MAG: hypothetical protein AAGJ86_00840 [Pseudomonadota bacterium]
MSGPKTSVPAKYAALAQRMTDGLRDALDDDPSRQTQQRSDYQRKAEDYQTLLLMDWLPAHAETTLQAYASIEIEGDIVANRQRLLSLLRDCYLDAARSQDGQ